MWPFSRTSKLPLPPWAFHSLDASETALRLSRGPWLVTDGAHLGGSVGIGDVSAPEATLSIDRGPDGLRSVTLLYTGTPAAGHRPTDIVIDSGYIVLCCRDEFVTSGVIDRGSLPLLGAVRKACGRADAVRVADQDGTSVGIVVAPPWGDGACRLYHEAAQGHQSIRIDVDVSA
jgi:hypothetical protein